MSVGEAGGGDTDWGPSRAAVLFGGERAPQRAGGRWDVAAHAGEPGAGEADFSLLRYWQVVARWRWLIASSIAVAMILGMIVTLLMPPIYKATATLEIDREAPKVVDSGSVEPTEVFDNEQFYQTQYGLLKSRSLAERVASSLNLANDAAFLRRGGAAKLGDETARERRAADLVLKGLTVEPVRLSQLVEVSYQSPDPATAARIANAIGDNFITANLERRFEASAYARQFLQSRLDEIRQKLEDSEKALVAYAAAHQIIDLNDAPTQTTDANGQVTPDLGGQSLPAADLGAMDAALDAARAQRIAAQEHWRQAQTEPGLALPEVLASPTVQALQQSKAALESDYQDKLSIYKPDFPAMQEIKAKIAEIDRQIDANVAAVKQSIQTQYKIAVSQEGNLAGQVNGLKSQVLDLRNRSIQYNIIQREVDTDRTLYDGLLERYKEVGVAGAVGANNISVIDHAAQPKAPFSPRPLFNLAIAGLVGLFAGVLMAFGIEQLDESIKAPEEVEGKLGIPLLGAIPMIAHDQAPSAALTDPRSALSEAYLSLRTALQFSTPHGAPRTLLITSARPEEGKTTTSAAVAQAFARLGLKVLLIDGDMRNPSLHRMFSRSQTEGLSTLLTGAGELTDAMQPSGYANLFLVTSGPMPPNPAELLAGSRLQRLIDVAAQEFAVVIIDGPPIMGLADAPLLASAADATALVIEAGTTRRGLIRTALRRLHTSHARVLGGVLAKFDLRKSTSSYGYGADYGYAYAYSYDYGARREPAAARLAWSKPGRWFHRR